MHRGYDHDRKMCPTFDHAVYDELIRQEEKRLQEAQEAQKAGLRTDTPEDGQSVREAARERVETLHGTPGPKGVGLEVRPEDLARCGDHICKRIAVRQGVPQIHGGGSTIRADCPTCGRHEQSWALIDLRGIEDPARSKIEDADLPHAPPGKMPPYACHACWTAWVRAELVTKVELLEGFGAPREMIERQRNIEERGP